MKLKKGKHEARIHFFFVVVVLKEETLFFLYIACSDIHTTKYTGGHES